MCSRTKNFVAGRASVQRIELAVSAARREVLGYSGLVAVNHWESPLSRKAIAAVLLPKRFDHGCSAGGLAIGELVCGPESRRSLEPP